MQIVKVTFTGKPDNYAKIDNYVSRSAQPQKADFDWLKNEGVTDVFNFRTMTVSGLDFDEKIEVEKRGMKYHNIPTITREPNEKQIDLFLKEIDEVKAKNGKAHIHCKAGADRTGMYAFVYKAKNKIGDIVENTQEWFAHGHNQQRYPKLEAWTKAFVKKKFV